MSQKLFRDDETRQWLRCAQEDLAAADALMSLPTPLLKTVLFHCQQAAEKAMKAFLVWHERTFTRSHNLIPLSNQCLSVDASVESVVIPARQLTQFAVRFRYPGEPEEPTVEEARLWLSVARSVVEAVLERLPKEIKR